MTRDELNKYYEAYNSNDFEAMARHYTEDCTFESRNMKASGKEILEYFRNFRDYFDETITPVSIVIEGDKAAVELDNYIRAKKDGGKYLNKTYNAGELLADRRVAVFYKIRGKKICNNKIYTVE